MRRAVALPLLGVLAALAVGGAVATAAERSGGTAARAAVTVNAAPVASAKLSRLACLVPAPTTAAGYAALFGSLDARQWGAADGAESVPLPDGRSLWLFGDTFSDHRFVHSTAILQDGGCLHVSHDGAQLLPNDRTGDIYWIDHARLASASHVVVTAQRIHLTGKCMMCFQDTGVTRAADVVVSAAGDATFGRWLGAGRRVAPAAALTFPAGAGVQVTSAGRVLLTVHPVVHEWIYSPQLHPELQLGSASPGWDDARPDLLRRPALLLLTMGHNWDDARAGLENYRPLFFAVRRG